MIIATHSEIQEVGGKITQALHSAPIAYISGGSYFAINSNWEDSGDATRPHQVLTAPCMVTAGGDGLRRIHPTRELDRYLEIGAPFVKTGGVWGKVALGNVSRSGNRLSWTRPQANMTIDMAGHFIKLEILFKGGFVPEENLLAFPVGMEGFTRSGRLILRDGVPVMRLNPLVVYDAANRIDTRQCTHEFTNVNGQPYIVITLPSMAGMTNPTFDPTFSNQPDASTGEDTIIVSGPAANTNYGIRADALQAGADAGSFVYRGLVKVPITSLPTNINPSVASLGLRFQSELNSTNRNINVHRSLVQWFEGAKDAATPDVGQDGSTWNNRNHNGPVAWAGGAGGVSGTEWAASATGTLAANSPGTNLTVDILADLRLFLGGTAYHGWWLISQSEGTASSLKRFEPSDSTTAANRPQINVTYVFKQYDTRTIGNLRGVMRGAR